MDNLISRLRRKLPDYGAQTWPELCHEAADRITSQSAEIARLTELLETIRTACEDEAYKVTVGQEPCRHTRAINDIHALATKGDAKP